MRVLLAFVALLSCATLFAQDETPLFRSQVNVVVAPTTVTDESGHYIADLKPYEFRLYDNNKEQSVHVDVAFVPISMVICVQANAGVEGIVPKIQRIGSLFKDIVIGEQGEAAVVEFDYRIRTLQDFTNDSNKIEQAFKKIMAGASSSALNDCINSAARMLSNRPKDRRRIILMFTESRDNGSSARAREVLTTLQMNNILLYSVDISHFMASLSAKAQPPRPDPFPASSQPPTFGAAPTPDTAAYQSTMGNTIPAFVEIFKAVKGIFIDNPAELYTKFTGGKKFSFKTQRGLEDAVARVGDELHSQYLLTYSPNNKLEGGFHTIQVVIDRGDLRVRTRPGYWMAGVPQ